MYERFTDRARMVMQLANQEAMRFKHEYIGTEHILLGLIAEASGVAANTLINLDIDLNRVRREVEAIIRQGPDRGDNETALPQTPRAKRVIEFAIAEARQLQHNHVGTEHLLLGLIRESEGVGAQVLMNLGLSMAVIRQEVMNLLGLTIDPAGKPKPLGTIDLPPRFAKASQGLEDVIEGLLRMKDEAVAGEDFKRAAALCDLRYKLLDVKEFLQGARHLNQMTDQEVTADLTVASSTPAPAPSEANDWPTNQFEIHIPLSANAGELHDSPKLDTFLQRLAERFGRVCCLRVPNAGFYERSETAQHGAAIHWSFFADDKPAASAFLREFREELEKALGLDRIVILCRKVTIH